MRLPERHRRGRGENILKGANSRRQRIAIVDDGAGQKSYEGEADRTRKAPRPRSRDESRHRTVIGWASRPSCRRRPRLRVLELTLAGALALTIPVAGRADPAGSKVEAVGAGPAPGIVQAWDRNGPSWYATRGAWHQAPSHLGQWKGAASPYWFPNGVPTYWVWGPSGGAFDYPFADWRGPTGGWGNP